MPQKQPKIILDTTTIHSPSRGSGQQLMLRIVAAPGKRGEWEYVTEKADPMDRDFKDILGNTNWRRVDIPDCGTEHNLVTGFIYQMLCRKLHDELDLLTPKTEPF